MDKLGIDGPSALVCHLSTSLSESPKGGVKRSDGASHAEPFKSLLQIEGIDSIELVGAYGLRVTIALLFTLPGCLMELQDKVIGILDDHFGCEMKHEDVFKKAQK